MAELIFLAWFALGRSAGDLFICLFICLFCDRINFISQLFKNDNPSQMQRNADLAVSLRKENGRKNARGQHVAGAHNALAVS